MDPELTGDPNANTLNDQAADFADGAQDTAIDAGGAPADAGEHPGARAEPSRVDVLLDSLTEGGHQPAAATPAGVDQGAQAGRPRDAHGRFLPANGQPAAGTTQQPARPGADSGAAPGGLPPAAQQPPHPDTRTPEEREQAELLQGITSPRGRERIQQMFAERREAQQGLGAIRDMVTNAGLTPETFTQQMEFARLANSSDPQHVRQAVEMLEGVRAQLYQRLGMDAPGVDALANHPDLAQAVASGQLAREFALETARLRRETAERQQRDQMQQQQEREQLEFQQAVATAEQQMKEYMASRANDADAPIRAKVVKDFFANPANLQRFAATYQPHQWFDVIKLMYDSAQVHLPPAPRAGQDPLRSRAGALGRPGTNANLSPEERTMQAINNMGL